MIIILTVALDLATVSARNSREFCLKKKKYFGAAEKCFSCLDLGLSVTLGWYADSAALHFVLK